METITWSGYEWLTRERWGSIHPGKSWNWYDPTAVEVNESGQLLLKIHRNPRDFVIDGKTVHSEYGTGLICCEREFGFGKYEIEAKLPSGNCLWPAWWMYPPVAWPPEIDIFEAYSKLTGYRKYSWLHKYFPRWFDDVRSWNVQSCIHTRQDEKIDQVPARNPDIDDFNCDPTQYFIKYGMRWLSSEISFYIDDVCVRKVFDRKVLDHLADYGPMMVILNNHIDGFDRDKFDVDNTTPFVVNYFRYEKS